MKVLAINGSHRTGRSTSKLLQMALDDFAAQGWDTELIELADKHIEYCIGCNSCLRDKPCPLLSREGDQMQEVLDAIMESDAVIVGSPNYFENVTARMKTFIDRTRPQSHMEINPLAGRVAGIVCTTGLSNCGIDVTAAVLQRFCNACGWITGYSWTVATCESGVDENGEVTYRRSADLDPQAQASLHNLTGSMMNLAQKLH